MSYGVRHEVSVHKCIEVGGGIFENLLWDVPDMDKPEVLSIADHQLHNDEYLHACEVGCDVIDYVITLRTRPIFFLL
jgi:hypothetical protein